MSIATRCSKSLWSYNPIPRGCVLYLPLWSPGLSGPVFKSTDPFGHTCTVTGATWGTQGRTFVAASSQKITCGNNAALFPTTYVSVAAWVYSADYSQSYKNIVGGDDDSAPYQIRTQSTTKKIEMSINTGVGTPMSIAMVDGTWNHIVGTYDQTLGSANIKVFLNGVVGPTSNYTTLISTVDTLHIGARGIGQYWDGAIAEVSIYNRALTPQEITYLYNKTKFRYT